MEDKTNDRKRHMRCGQEDSRYILKESKNVWGDNRNVITNDSPDFRKEESQKNRKNDEDHLESLAFFLVGVLLGGIVERLLTYLNGLLG